MYKRKTTDEEIKLFDHVVMYIICCRKWDMVDGDALLQSFKWKHINIIKNCFDEMMIMIRYDTIWWWWWCEMGNERWEIVAHHITSPPQRALFADAWLSYRIYVARYQFPFQTILISYIYAAKYNIRRLSGLGVYEWTNSRTTNQTSKNVIRRVCDCDWVQNTHSAQYTVYNVNIS